MAEFQGEQARLLVHLGFSGAVFSSHLFAELIANDKPLLLRFDGDYYFPAFVSYPETAFGGDFDTQADYRDPFLKDLIAAKDGRIWWPPIRYSYDTINLDLPVPAPAPPSADNWLGTDDQARDVMARLIYGFRISVLFGLTLTLFSSVVGRHCRRGAGLFRRLDRSGLSALHRGLDIGADHLSADHSGRRD